MAKKEGFSPLFSVVKLFRRQFKITQNSTPIFNQKDIINIHERMFVIKEKLQKVKA